MLDVGWGDLIDYLGDDPNTHSIVIAMETVGDARGFLSAAREVALTKPIIVIKPGRTEPSARIVAVARPGSSAESDEVLEAAFRRGGVLRAHTIADVFYLADVLAKQPRPRGSRLAIVTNARGPGHLAVDALVGQGGSLAELAPEPVAGLGAILLAAAVAAGPTPSTSAATPTPRGSPAPSGIAAVSRDPGTDGVLVILAPQAQTDPTGLPRRSAPVRPEPPEADPGVVDGRRRGRRRRRDPESGRHPRPSRTPTPPPASSPRWPATTTTSGPCTRRPPSPPNRPTTPPGRPRGDAIHQPGPGSTGGPSWTRSSRSAASSPRTGWRWWPPASPPTEDEAVAAAEAIGFPVALKLYSRTIASGSEVGGVRLDLGDAEGVRAAFGGSRRRSPQIEGGGHMLGVSVQPMVRTDARSSWPSPAGSTRSSARSSVFGAGGALAEVYRDRSLACRP